jgi:hypothetical protein
MGSSDVTAQAPPSQTIHKKRSSEKYKSASQQALVPVQVLPEKQYAHEGKIINHEDNFAKKAHEKYEDKKWNEFLDQEEPEMTDVATGTGFRGIVKTEKMAVDGERKKFYSNKVAYGGNATGKLENELFDRDVKKSKQRINVGSNLKDFNKVKDDDIYIDADFEDIKKSPKFRKVNKDARDLGMPKAKPKREQPAGIRAISDQKEEMKSKINDLANPKNRVDEGSPLVSPTKRVSPESLVTPSQRKRKEFKDPIDTMFDGLVGAGRGIAGVAKAGAAGVGAGFDALDAGAKVFGNSTIGTNIMGQVDADYKHMRENARHAGNSITAAGGYTTGSSSSSSSSSNSGKYNRTSNGRLEIKGYSCKMDNSGKIKKTIWRYKGEECKSDRVKAALTASEMEILRKDAEDISNGNYNHTTGYSDSSLKYGDGKSYSGSGSSSGSSNTLTRNKDFSALTNKGTKDLSALTTKATTKDAAGTIMATRGGKDAAGTIMGHTGGKDATGTIMGTGGSGVGYGGGKDATGTIMGYKNGGGSVVGAKDATGSIIGNRNTGGGFVGGSVGGSVGTTKDATGSIIGNRNTGGFGNTRNPDGSIATTKNIGGINTTKNAGGSIIGNRNNTGGVTTMKTNTNIVVGTKTASPSGLFGNKQGSIHTQTIQVTPSKINRRKTGNVASGESDLSPSRLFRKNTGQVASKESELSTSRLFKKGVGQVGAQPIEATKSKIYKRKSGGIHADTREATPSKINKRKSGGIRTESRPSQMLGKIGNSDKTVVAGVTRTEGEIGTNGSGNGIVGNKKQATVGSIITPRRHAGVGAA